MPKYEALEVKLHLRSKAESYSMVLEKWNLKFVMIMTNDSISFHNGNYEMLRETIF